MVGLFPSVIMREGSLPETLRDSADGLPGGYCLPG